MTHVYRQGRPWSDDEIERLKQCCDAKMTYAQMSLVFYRNMSAIQNKIYLLGLEYKGVHEPTEPYMDGIKKRDMIGLPRHKDGKRVSYA